MTRITRWPDGRIRARGSWEPELRNILAEDVAQRGISWDDKLYSMEQASIQDSERTCWGEDFAVVLEVCRAMVAEDAEELAEWADDPGHSEGGA